MPNYMIPTLFIPCNFMPSITSTKLDRKILRQLVVSLNNQQLATYSLQNGLKRMPENDIELQLQGLWADLLNISIESIGRDDNFLQIGGDSILAIQLASRARKLGISFQVKDLFDDPRLLAISSKATMTAFEAETEVIPFSLLSNNLRDAVLSSAVRTQCCLSDEHIIEDAYPCTSIQEGLMSLSMKQPGSYIAKYLYRLPAHVDVSRFKSAWKKTVKLCANLRTRIIHTSEGSSIQVVCKPSSNRGPREYDDLQSVLHHAREVQMTYGSSLCEVAFVEDEQQNAYFFWEMHHAIFDGISMQTILSILHKAYFSDDIPAITPYSHFIRYVLQTNVQDASSYWASQLQNAKPSLFPPLHNASRKPGATRTLERSIGFINPDKLGVTVATVVRSAWAIVLARYCDTDDVCFGTTISGRQAPVPDIFEIVGPTIATLPVRLKIDNQQLAPDFLQTVQKAAAEMIPYEQFGLQRIMKLGEDAYNACQFSSLLVIQPMRHISSTEDSNSSLLTAKRTEGLSGSLSNYFSYPLIVQAHIYDDELKIAIFYDSDILTERQVHSLSNHFGHVIQQLTSGDTLSLQSISISSTYDLELAVAYNSDVPEVIDSCIHELIDKQAQIAPNAPAISAWDGEFTYHQLMVAANRLSYHLIHIHKVKPGEIILVCLEKTARYIVSAIAINKVGAVWAPLEPSQPEGRLLQIASQTEARLAVSSPKNAALCAKLVQDVIEVSAKFDYLLANSVPESYAPCVATSSQDAAYILFTSGSTGTPKGLVIENGSVCTSQTALAKRLKLTPSVRILQFATFIFDMSVGEIIAPLISGACVCMPSDNQRINGIVEFIQEQRVNWAFLTPSFARTIQPRQVPSLELLVLGGEPIPQDVFLTWFGSLRLINGWGPAETCVVSALHEWTSAKESSNVIGRPVGGFCWVVDPDMPQHLAPIGTVGELAVQGPTLLREYLNDPRKTEAALIPRPSWAPLPHDHHFNRFYLSGDLGFYNEDGNIVFSGRRGTQVKIRGLRVELAEVEHHIRDKLGAACDIAVDVVTTATGTSLVAFVSFDRCRQSDPSGDDYGSNVFLQLNSYMQDMFHGLVGQL